MDESTSVEAWSWLYLHREEPNSSENVKGSAWVVLLSVPWEAWAVQETNWNALPKTSNALVRPAGRYRPPLFSFERTPPILEWFVSPKLHFKLRKKTSARDQKCSKIVRELKFKKRYSPILRQLQQLVLHILDPFMVFSKLIMIRNRTKITILILDLYLDPFSLTQNEPFLSKKHFRPGQIFRNFGVKF